jgi:hypothetical protein
MVGTVEGLSAIRKLVDKMRTQAWVAWIIGVWLMSAATLNAAEPCAQAIPCKRIAVMELKVSGDYSEQVKSWLPALIEDRLLKEGWTLVVRGERMRHIQEERNLGGLNPATKLPDNQIIGATAFIELVARVQVKSIQGAIGYKAFTLGDYARASVDITGQIVDPATGLLKTSVTTGGSAGGLKTAAVITIGDDWKIGAGGYNLAGVKSSLVGKAADVAAARFIEKLKCIYPSIPGQPAVVKAPATQLSSTTVSASPTPTILIDLPDSGAASVGDRFGVYRGETMIAELEIARLFGKRAEARVLSQTTTIAATDVARKIVVLKATD